MSWELESSLFNFPLTRSHFASLMETCPVLLLDRHFFRSVIAPWATFSGFKGGEFALPIGAVSANFGCNLSN